MHRPYENPQEGTLEFQQPKKRTKRTASPKAQAAGPPASLVPQRGGGGPDAGPVDEEMFTAGEARVFCETYFVAAAGGSSYERKKCAARMRFFYAHLAGVALSDAPEDCSSRLLALLERTQVKDAELLLSKYYHPEEKFRKGQILRDVVCCVVDCGATGSFKCTSAYTRVDPRILIHCRNCHEAWGLHTSWVMQQTAEERQASEQKKQESLRRAAERTSEIASERRIAVAASVTPATSVQLASGFDFLENIITKGYPAGEAFVHGESRMCLCNCGCCKAMRHHEPAVRMTGTYLLGATQLRKGDVVFLDPGPVCKLVHEAREIDRLSPGKRDRRAFVPYNAAAAAHPSTPGVYGVWPEYGAVAQKLDAMPGERPYEYRVSLVTFLQRDAVLPAALPRSGRDWAGVILSEVVGTVGKIVVGIPVKNGGKKSVIHAMCYRRMAGVGALLSYSDEDFARFEERLTEAEIKKVVETSATPKKAIVMVNTVAKLYNRALRKMDKALRWAFDGEMPAAEVLAPYLDKIRFGELDATDKQLMRVRRAVRAVARACVRVVNRAAAQQQAIEKLDREAAGSQAVDVREDAEDAPAEAEPGEEDVPPPGDAEDPLNAPPGDNDDDEEEEDDDDDDEDFDPGDDDDDDDEGDLYCCKDIVIDSGSGPAPAPAPAGGLPFQLGVMLSPQALQGLTWGQ